MQDNLNANRRSCEPTFLHVARNYPLHSREAVAVTWQQTAGVSMGTIEGNRLKVCCRLGVKVSGWPFTWLTVDPNVAIPDTRTLH
jgi:hypothetical protein